MNTKIIDFLKCPLVILISAWGLLYFFSAKDTVVLKNDVSNASSENKTDPRVPQKNEVQFPNKFKKVEVVVKNQASEKFIEGGVDAHDRELIKNLRDSDSINGGDINTEESHSD